MFYDYVLFNSSYLILVKLKKLILKTLINIFKLVQAKHEKYLDSILINPL